MLIKRPRGWELPSSSITPEACYEQRRRFLKGAAAGSLVALGSGLLAACGEGTSAAEAGSEPSEAWADPSAGLYPVPRNEAFTVERAITEEALATTYNNFYEFGSSKTIWPAAAEMELRPWTISIGGAVEEPREIAIDDLLDQMPLEERGYRLRCVEASSMVVSWCGCQLSHLLGLARPLSKARYVRFITAEQPEAMRGLRATWYPWPYQEGLTMEEAAHELAFMATGIYGKPLPAQNGGP